MQVGREGGGAPYRVVLVSPRIPPNAGNAARTCAATGTPLHLVEPLGFSLDDRHLRRAGLDYWPHVELSLHRDFDAFREAVPGGRLVYFSAGGAALLHDFRFAPGDALVFGPENPGLLWGPGPRGGQALITAARARAFLQGRAVPLLEDVAALLQPALGHRVQLGFAARSDGRTVAELIRTIESGLE